jgi:tRNA threonylcarbamoyladenosine dehydratase
MGAKPVIYDPKNESIEEFSRRYPVQRVVDLYEKELFRELFLIRNPRYRFNAGYNDALATFVADHADGRPLCEAGSWFYYQGNQTLVHFLPDEMHQELRTARNRYLITREEQEKLYNFKVGIAGLSVGSHAALTIAMMGGGRFMRLADPDAISGTNLNRIRLDYTYLGQNKCNAVTDLIYRMNPYCEIDSYPEGIEVTDEGIERFLSGLDVFVECADHPELKIRSRLIAKRLRIPVIMATDNGDGIIFDTERYDIEPDTELFNGASGHLTLDEFKKFRPEELPKLATKIAGINAVQPRMLHSVSEVGKSLYSWPQLGDAATLTGVAIAYVVKRLALGLPVTIGKTEINLDAIFDPNYNDTLVVERRQAERREYLRRIGFEDSEIGAGA